jgi:crotonobetainyl-CoA:carnitine CoA-transferase CaiB-like acyl-CoA transferase
VGQSVDQSLPSKSADAAPGPLAGIRILDLATMLVGPMAAQAMGDMGADVIKVEAPGGDLMRRIGPRTSPDMGAFFLGSNRNKRSLELDLKAPQDQQVFEALVRTSDVVLHSIRADAAARLGLSYERLAALRPDIILCRVMGFGDDGLQGGKPAYDDVAQAASGLAMLQKVVAGEPRYVASCMADKIASMYAMQAISMALIHRLRTGRGQEVCVPMFEAMVSFNMHEHLWGETFVPARGGMGYPPQITAARRPFRTADGYLCVLPYKDKHWAAFCELVGDPELTADPRWASHAARQSDQTGFWNEVGRRVSAKTTAQWIEALAGADIPFSPVNSLEDLVVDPHLHSVGFWQEFEHPTEGTLRMTANPIDLKASPPSIRRLAPRLGEHNEDILAELGLQARKRPA